MSCKKKFTECEMDLLKLAQSEAEHYQEVEITPEIKEMLYIIEDHIRSPDYICYGGTAINNILPKKHQFYDYTKEIPDYDVFCKNALDKVKKIADYFYKQGFENVLAKSGVHIGTFKLYVNNVALLDLTELDENLFDHIYKDAIKVSGIHYAPPNFLRQSMYLELSSPAGMVSRWEKILTRLNLLNKFYPIKTPKECRLKDKSVDTHVYNIIKNELIHEDVVFIGAYADSLYSKFIPKNKSFKHTSHFDVLSTEPNKTVNILKKTLESENIHNITIIKHSPVGELIKEHFEIKVDKQTMCFIYEPYACHSYNIVTIEDDDIKIATIDTLLTYYLTFIYAGRPYYDLNRILCMCHLLFNIQQQNRLSQKGLLKRFSVSCYGTQKTLSSITDYKMKLFNELKNNKHSREYEEVFLSYSPNNLNKSTEKSIEKSTKKSSTKKNVRFHHKIKKTRKHN